MGVCVCVYRGGVCVVSEHLAHVRSEEYASELTSKKSIPSALLRC